MKANYSFSSINPTPVQFIGTLQKPLYQVLFDTEEVNSLVNDEESTSGQSLIKQYKSLFVQVKSLDYATLVSAIIESRYSNDEVSAIMLNSLEALDLTSSITDEKRADYLAEYADLQAWRAHAKEIAREVASL